MRSLADDRLDLARPALIVTYGTTSRKRRLLERDLVIVGRAPGCDVALASPEVAPVHCVLARGPQGWRVRDCSGRGATRVNGTPVVEGPLRHGDTLQVGAFSFEAYLPESAEGKPAHEPAAPALAAAVPIGRPLPAQGDADAHRKDMRARELAQYAEHLRRHEQEVNARLAQRQEEVAKAEATLREQRAEVVRRMSELARAGQNVVPTSKAKSDSASRQDAESLRMQLSMVRQELAGRDSIIAGLRVRLEQLERDLSARQADEHEQEEIAKQRKEIAEQLAQLEERRTELEEATREAELQAASERTQLARDRAELQQLLEDFRFEQQNAQNKEEAPPVAMLSVPLKRENGSPRLALRSPLPSAGSHPGTHKWVEFGSREDSGE